MATRARAEATFAPSRQQPALHEKIDYTDPQVLMFNNLLLLGFNAAAMEKKQGVPFGPTMFSNTGATRQCDCVVHFLLSKIYPNEAASEFKSVWPILDRVQQREFKKIACGMLAKLQKADAIPSQPQIRPSSLDTPYGDRFCMLLWAISNHAFAIEFKRRYPLKFASTPQLSTSPEMARIVIPVALRHEQLLRNKFIKSAEHLANLDSQWTHCGDALASTYRELRSQFASLQEQAQAIGMDPLTAAEQDDEEPTELPHVRDWYQRFASDYAEQEYRRALVLDILNQRSSSASLDSAKISAALGDANDASGPVDLSLLLDKWNVSLEQLRQELCARGGHSSSIASVAAQADALKSVVEKRNDMLSAVVKLKQEAGDALSDAAKSLRRRIVNLGTHVASFPPSPSLRLAPSPPSTGELFTSGSSPAAVSGFPSSAATPSTLRRAPSRLWPLESGCVAAAGALTPTGMQRLADSVRKAAKREAGVSVSVAVHLHEDAEKHVEGVQPQVLPQDSSHPRTHSSGFQPHSTPLLASVPSFTGSVFTPPESSESRSAPSDVYESLPGNFASSTSLSQSCVADNDSTFITTPEHLKKLESSQRVGLAVGSATLLSSPVFPSSLRKNASPPPPPPQCRAAATGFQAPPQKVGFGMPSKQRLLSAAAAKNAAALREKALPVPASKIESSEEDQLAKVLASKRRLALQQMNKNAIAEEIVDGVVGAGEVFNKNPFEIRKELPRTPETHLPLANSHDLQSSTQSSLLSPFPSASRKSPAQATMGATSVSSSIVTAKQSSVTLDNTQPSPAHQSAAAAYYAALLNPTPPRVTAAAIDMASPLLKEFVPSYSASSTPLPTAPSVKNVAPSPFGIPSSPSRYAGDPFPPSPAAHFKPSHFDQAGALQLDQSDWGTVRGTPNDVAGANAAFTDAPNSTSSASSWLKRRENSQSDDLSNLPSPDLAGTGSTPWKTSSSIPAATSLDIGDMSFEDGTNNQDAVFQRTPSHSKESISRLTCQQESRSPDVHVNSQQPLFREAKAKVTDSESPSNLPKADSKIFIDAGSSTPSLSAIKRKSKSVAVVGKVSPQPRFQSNAVSWGVSVNSDCDSVPSTTTSTWTSTSAPSDNVSEADADSESAPYHQTTLEQPTNSLEHDVAALVNSSYPLEGPVFHAPLSAAPVSGATDAATDSDNAVSSSEQWGSLVDTATAKSPVSKFHASWCMPSPTRRRTSVTPSILHTGVQPSPFNNPAVFTRSPHDSSMESSGRIDDDVTVNMGYYNPSIDASMRTAKDSPYISQSPTDMDISVDREPAHYVQCSQFAGVHQFGQYSQFARADSSSSAASSVVQEDDMDSGLSQSDFPRQSSASGSSDRNSFVAPSAAAVPRMELLKELLARKKSPPTTAPSPLSRIVSSTSIASSVLHEAAIKASNFVPSSGAAVSMAAGASNFQDELRKRLSTVKANTNVGASVTMHPPVKVSQVSDSPYVQKSVGELRKKLLDSKVLIGGAGVTVKSNSLPLREAVGRPSLDFTSDSPPNVKMVGFQNK